jgi:hypothetical protein
VLGADSGSAYDLSTGLATLGSCNFFGFGDALLQAFDKGRTGIGCELGWNKEWQSHGGRHLTVRPKKGGGPIGGKGFVCDHRSERTDTWPLLHLLDQLACHWVCKGIHHLLKHVLGFYQLDSGRLFRSPHCLPPAVKSVLVLGNEFVEIGQKIRQPAFYIEDAGVMVVGHRDRENDPDTVLQRSHAKTVDEGIIGRFVRP